MWGGGGGGGGLSYAALCEEDPYDRCMVCMRCTLMGKGFGGNIIGPVCALPSSLIAILDQWQDAEGAECNCLLQPYQYRKGDIGMFLC